MRVLSVYLGERDRDAGTDPPIGRQAVSARASATARGRGVRRNERPFITRHCEVTDIHIRPWPRHD